MPLHADSLAPPVAWAAGRELPPETPLRLEFHLRDGELYGFEV